MLHLFGKDTLATVFLHQIFIIINTAEESTIMIKPQVTYVFRANSWAHLRMVMSHYSRDITPVLLVKQLASESGFRLTGVTYCISILSSGALHELENRTTHWFVPKTPKHVSITGRYLISIAYLFFLSAACVIWSKVIWSHSVISLPHNILW